MKFAIIGIDHGHVFMMINNLLAIQGVSCAGYFTEHYDLEKQMTRAFPHIGLARNEADLLENPEVDLIVSASVPSLRGPLAIRALNHDKHFLADVPFPTTLDHLRLLELTQARSGKCVFAYLRERLLCRAELLAGKLIRAGEIGRPVNFVGLEPHKLMIKHRPAWQFRRDASGGVLAELGVHALDSFCFLTDQSISRGTARSGNLAHPKQPDFDDFGDFTFEGSEGATGYARVDWLTPDALPSFGDIRSIVLGTDGYLEIRKKLDLAVDNTRYTGDTLLICSRNREPERIDCRHVPATFHEELVRDVRDGVNRCLPEGYFFGLMRAVLQMRDSADRLGWAAAAAQTA
ncbi:MAG: Gfo/Idh/MocA family oxidoreductase [Verrucomicrobiae bacterium]|nr:Gfo/Idh/MocA family oxidoreductase [Verrucomicrobiae bacterium]